MRASGRYGRPCRLGGAIPNPSPAGSGPTKPWRSPVGALAERHVQAGQRTERNPIRPAVAVPIRITWVECDVSREVRRHLGSNVTDPTFPGLSSVTYVEG